MIGTSEPRGRSRESARIRAAVRTAEDVFAVDGVGFTGNAPNRGTAFLPLRRWDERRGADRTFTAIQGRLAPDPGSPGADHCLLARSAGVRAPEAQVFAFNPQVVQGVGNFGGFQFQLLDEGDERDAGFGERTQSVRALLGGVKSNPRRAHRGRRASSHWPS